jgi:hypothetical protein
MVLQVFQGRILLLVEISGRSLFIKGVTWSIYDGDEDCTSLFSLHVGISRTKFLKEGRL